MIKTYFPLFQILRVRCGAGRVHADLCTLPVPGHPPWTGDADWTGLRAGGERMRVQAKVLDWSRPGAQYDTIGWGRGTSKKPPTHQEHQQQPKELSEFWVGAELRWLAKLMCT